MKKFNPGILVQYRFYLISFTVLLLWLTFFDRSSLLKQFDMAMELRNLQNEKLHYEKELKNITEEENQVLGSFSSLEKYGREKYLLKKKGETLFVLVDDNDKIFEEKD